MHGMAEADFLLGEGVGDVGETFLGNVVDVSFIVAREAGTVQ